MTIFPIIWLAAFVVAIVLLITFQPDHHVTWLVVIVLLTVFAGWVCLPDNPGIVIDFNNDGEMEIDKTIAVRQGLDLAGGLQVLLEADLPGGEEPSDASMNEVRRIVEDRINALGALEPVVQRRGNNRLIVELPGYQNPDEATNLIRETALLEFVELPSWPDTPMVGTPILTDHTQNQHSAAEEEETPSPTAEATAEGEATPEAEATQEPADPLEFVPDETIYPTVMTGDMLVTADVGVDQSVGTQYVINFTLTKEGADIFDAYTESHIGGVLGIVLDGVLVSAPTIQAHIPDGKGNITGDFTREEAQQLATQLRYGALPVPLRVQSTNTVGPTLGQISVEQSIRAGVIGIGVVLLFMLIYYRVPGISAALALLIFAVLNFAVYKLLPVTMTLPAITGFLISVGTAVDGNILIFERMKEELRAGKRLRTAVDAGFDRAWTSIRDSNLSSLIICAILWAFGSSYGAGAVTGFAVTLAIGLFINLFTAVVATRTFLHFILMPISEEALQSRRWLVGL
ncbi:MAG: protein translocase subunit SecD [Anaerolineae bacterium]|nr:protein translocase subunit SecD [Anaerolineae bacterium]